MGKKRENDAESYILDQGRHRPILLVLSNYVPLHTFFRLLLSFDAHTHAYTPMHYHTSTLSHLYTHTPLTGGRRRRSGVRRLAAASKRRRALPLRVRDPQVSYGLCFHGAFIPSSVCFCLELKAMCMLLHSLSFVSSMYLHLKALLLT